MTRNQKDSILLTSFRFRTLWTNRIVSAYKLSRYDADEVFSMVIELQAELLERDKNYQIWFLIQRAYKKFKEFISVDFVDRNETITEVEHPTVEQLDFDYLIYQKLSTLNAYNKKLFIEHIRKQNITDKNQITAKCLIREFEIIVNQLTYIQINTQFVNLDNDKDVYRVTEIYKQTNINGDIDMFYKLKNKSRTVELYDFELLGFIIENNLSRISVKNMNMSKKELIKFKRVKQW